MTADKPAGPAEGQAESKGPDPAGTTSGDQSAGPGLKDGGRGSFDEQAADAYEAGRQRFRLPRGTFTSGRDQDIHIGNRFHLQVGAAGSPAPGPVPVDDIDAVRSCYAHVAAYNAMHDCLSNRGLLVLAGAPRSGRTTTALHLLDSLTKTEGGLARVDAQPGLAGLDEESLEREHGYLVTLPAGVALSRPQADRLSALCRDRSSFCVAVVDHGSSHVRTLQSYVVAYQPPQPTAVLQAHIDRQILASDVARLADRLLELVTDEWIRSALGPDPRPAVLAATAVRLVEHGRTSADLTDLSAVEAFCARLLEVEVEQWFAALRVPLRGDRGDRVLRLAAYRIALAVFDGLPRHVIGDAAEDLVDRLVTVTAPLRKAGRPPVLDDEDAFLDDLHAELVDGTVRYGAGSVPAVLLQYRDQRLPAAVLSHVWQRHHNLRAPLGRWLRKLARDDRSAVRVRAAQAVGLLCAVDFSYTFPEIVEPAAAATPRKNDASSPDAGIGADDDTEDEETWELRREFAAVALDQAATGERVRDTVLGILRRWRRSGDPALRWTAALTLGYELGCEDIDRTLDELRVIGTPQEKQELLDGDDHDDEWDLVWVAGHSLAQLFARRARAAVLSQLTEWLGPRHKRSLQLLSQQAVVILAGLRMSALADPGGRGTSLFAGGPTRPGRWPLLLALVADDEQLVGPVAELLRTTLRGRGRQLTEDAIAGWMRTADDDAALLAELERFLPALAVDQSDRGRLLHLVGRLRHSWADSLPAHTADRLEAALARRY